MKVLKFGGSSVGSKEAIDNLVKIVRREKDQNPVVVVSAIKGTTNLLSSISREKGKEKRLDLFQQIKSKHVDLMEKLEIDFKMLDEFFNQLLEICNQENNLSGKQTDKILCFGERISCRIISAYLSKKGIDSQAFETPDIGYITNSEYGRASLLEESPNNIKDNLEKLTVVPVIAGFIGKTNNGEYTTNGRGGSDLTASEIAAAIDATELQIWTDVHGIMSTDPRIISGAHTLDFLSYSEMSELSYFGAKVLHPKTIRPIMKKNIPLRVLNTFDPDHKGTTILSNIKRKRDNIVAIAYKKNIALINISSSRMLGARGFLSKLFLVFEKNDTSVDALATSEVSVSMTVDNASKIKEIENDLKDYGKIETKKNKVLICVVGEVLSQIPGWAGKVFGVMADEKINVEMISQGASKINITFVVDEQDIERAVAALHDEFFKENGKN